MVETTSLGSLLICLRCLTNLCNPFTDYVSFASAQYQALPGLVLINPVSSCLLSRKKPACVTSVFVTLLSRKRRVNYIPSCGNRYCAKDINNRAVKKSKVYFLFFNIEVHVNNANLATQTQCFFLATNVFLYEEVEND